KEVCEKPPQVRAFRVYVVQKKPTGDVPVAERIPPQVLGVPTDVVLEPTPQLIEDESKYRPLLGGIRIRNDTSPSGGTLGCIAQLTSDGSMVMLSNHHVMLSGGAARGETIGPPSLSRCR